MNVILLENVENLGSIGDLVKVKPGYGRNYLLPQGKAALATPENMKEIEARRAELEKAAAEELAAAKTRAGTIEGMELVIPANAGPEGKLFGSVTSTDVVTAVEEQANVVLDRRALDGEPIKELGTHMVTAKVHADVQFPITVEVIPDA